MEAVQLFDYNGQQIGFEFANGSVMINATEMAKIFDKKVENFTRIDTTKLFIEAYVNKQNKTPKSVLFSENDIIKSVQKSGTWMHRILALKFAAWLNPDFEVWIYETIDEILFGRYRDMEDSIKLSAVRKNEIDTLKREVENDVRLVRIQQLENEEKQAAKNRTKHIQNQLALFRGL